MDIKNENDYLPTFFQQYIYKSRYSKFLDDEGRRESWPETPKRYVDFFRQKADESFPHLNSDNKIFDEIENEILNTEVMPSMRAFMTAGKALDKENIAGYNCAYRAVDEPRAFDEILYILMNGTGVGFSVERQYINQLPSIPDELHETDTTIIVRDSKLGWAIAFKELISLLYTGQIPQWDMSKVRAAGSRLKTFGGRASGPEPLNKLFKFTVNLFRGAQGRKLSSIECHDLVCSIADIVVVGGVRRAALISYSNLSDERLRSAKTGRWWEDNPQRALANNSVAYSETPEMELFMKEWLNLVESKSGERGIYNINAAKKKFENLNEEMEDGAVRRVVRDDVRTNPCSEILLRNKQFCNLTEIVARSEDTIDDLKRKAYYATIMGTMQASLTKFRHLSKEWKDNCEEEALLGVSITGIMDNPILANRTEDDLEEILEDIRQYTVEVNKEWAEKIGVNPSAAITTVKPSGCVTLDTKIKTGDGTKDMANIFAEYTPSVDITNCQSGSWIDLEKPLKVFDKNNEEKNVNYLFVNGMEEVFELTFEDGNSYKFTSKHKLLTNNGWKQVKDIEEGDEVIDW